MSDLFAGILDSLRSSVTDANSFFGATMTNPDPLGTAVARGLVGSHTGNQANPALAYGNTRAKALENAHALSEMYNVPHTVSPRAYEPSKFENGKFPAAKSEDYYSVEQQWLQRLHRFGQIDTAINAGKVNEGPDR